MDSRKQKSHGVVRNTERAGHSYIYGKEEDDEERSGESVVRHVRTPRLCRSFLAFEDARSLFRGDFALPCKTSASRS